MQLSIIIPVYNAREHLGRCLDSVLEQQCTSGPFEVIAVDDGSTDGSVEILRAYQQKYPRLVVIEHGRNKKLSVARTTGMKAAAGRYILHVDSDDWLLPGSLDALLGVIERDMTDVIIFNHARSDGKDSYDVVQTVDAEAVVSPDQRMFPHFFKACWNKVVKRELVTDMVYHECKINHSEDFVFGVEVFIKSRTISLLPGVYYVYFQNPASLTKTVTTRELIEIKMNVVKALKRMKEKYGDRDGWIATALCHQVKMIHKRLALHSLGDHIEVEWGGLLALVDEVEGRQMLSREITQSAESVTGRVFNLYRYWGSKWALSYVVNGLLLPRMGLGWKGKRKRI